MNLPSYIFLSIEAYVTKKGENIEIPVNPLLLRVSNYNISSFVWVYIKLLFKDFGLYGKYLF